MDDCILTGHDNEYGYSVGHGSPGNTMNNLNYDDICMQESHGAQETLSMVQHPRHDSMFSASSAHHGQFPIGQHQAEAQPCAATLHMTPHSNTTYLVEAQSMSRGPSQWSNPSSAASVPQYSSSQPWAPHNPFQGSASPSSVHMMRSFSERSNVHGNPIDLRHSMSGPYQMSTTTFASPQTQNLPFVFPITPSYSPPIGNADDPITDWSSNNLGRLDDTRILVDGFGQTLSGSSNRLMVQVPQARRRTKSDFSPLNRPLQRDLLATSQSSTVVEPSASSGSTRSQSPQTEPQQKRRRRKTPPSDSESDKITGHVLASGQFKCAKLECADLRFGRQADFRRHWTNVHARTRIEYFCTFEGCDRSKRPSNRGKGRSFGNRRDKMEEHKRTVHGEADKRKKAFEPEADEIQGDEEDIFDEEILDDSETYT